MMPCKVCAQCHEGVWAMSDKGGLHRIVRMHFCSSRGGTCMCMMP